MAEKQLRAAEEEQEDLPVYFAKLGTGSPKPRQKYGGMFCNVEGAYENKTIDFDSLSVGKRSGRSAGRNHTSQVSLESDGLSESASDISE
eukprot:g33756.t1